MKIYTQSTQLLNFKNISPAKYNYNCSFISKNKLIYRCQDNLLGNSWLGYSNLDDDFNPIDYQKINIPKQCAEDPRVVVKNKEIFIFFNNGQTWEIDGWNFLDFTIHVAVFDLDMNLKYCKPLLYTDRQDCEKNWQMFYDYEECKWKCLYSIQPWQILTFDDNWVGTISHNQDYKIQWNWGVIRGGASPTIVLPPAGKFSRQLPETTYYSWFHSSYAHPLQRLNAKRQYISGIVSFDARTLKPTGISKIPLLYPIGKSVVSSDVVFPGGAIYDDNKWIIASGSGDCKCRIDTIDHDEAICSLNFQRIF